MNRTLACWARAHPFSSSSTTTTTTTGKNNYKIETNLMSASKKWMRAHADNESFVVAAADTRAVPVLRGPHSSERRQKERKKNHFAVISIVNRIASQLIVIARARAGTSLEICRWIQLTHGWRATLDGTAIRDNFCRFQFNIVSWWGKKTHSVAAVGRCLLLLYFLCVLQRIQLRTAWHRVYVDNVNVAHYYRHFDAKYGCVASSLRSIGYRRKICSRTDGANGAGMQREKGADGNCQPHILFNYYRKKQITPFTWHPRLHSHRCGNYTPHIVASQPETTEEAQ